jgi:hypothetical protein
MLLKILIYGGATIFAALILIGIFSFKPINKHSYTGIPIDHRRTKEDKVAMTNACVLNAKTRYQRDSVKTRAICECVTESITSKYTYEQTMELDKQSREDQMKVTTPIIKTCLAEINSGK